MGGKGWSGKSTGMTFDQLQSLGVGRGEGPGPTLAPPPLYPKMENIPLPLTIDPSMDHMLILKKQLIEHFHDSPAFVQPRAAKTGIERYSDKYKLLLMDTKNDKSSFYSWSNMPKELRPLKERKENTPKAPKRKAAKDTVDVDFKLTKLEELEKNTVNEDTEKNEPGGSDKNSSDEENNESDKEDVEDPDEEMDDNTDYLNNYFDNGEAFDDEDDNLDEGPVY